MSGAGTGTPDGAGARVGRRAALADRARAVSVLLLVMTIAQLAVAATVPLDRFEGKAFGARLVAYPVMMLVLPAIWAVRRRPLPWAAFVWTMLPFVVDVTGNTLDLYDSVGWWDDANHFVNWLFLGLGTGLLLERGGVRPAWALWVAVTGLGAVLAIGWELGEWFTFIRHGTEIGTAYTDTLGDEALGTLGAAVAASVLVGRGRDAEERSVPGR